MKPGQWLQPRHGSHEAFLKDFPTIEPNGLDMTCPGCKEVVRVTRRAPTGKLGGWCKRCNRGIAP